MPAHREWYISFHGGAGAGDLNNLHVYSSDGKKLRKALDRDHLPAEVDLRELRGFTFGPDGDLYVANAYKEASQILRFKGKLDDHAQHRLREVFVTADATHNPGLSHPFSVTFDTHGDLFVTSQNTSLVLRYHGPQSKAGRPGAPMPLPSALADLPGAKFSPGTFCAAAAQVVHGLQVVREAAFAGGRLYVVDRDADAVKKFDPKTGAYLGEIIAKELIDKPIQIAAHGGVLYIGNRGNESVVQCDLASERVTTFIQPKAGGLRNPAGLALGHDGYLYVASRTAHEILRFRCADGRPDERPFIDYLDDEPAFVELIERRH